MTSFALISDLFKPVLTCYDLLRPVLPYGRGEILLFYVRVCVCVCMYLYVCIVRTKNTGV